MTKNSTIGIAFYNTDRSIEFFHGVATQDLYIAALTYLRKQLGLASADPSADAGAVVVVVNDEQYKAFLEHMKAQEPPRTGI